MANDGIGKATLQVVSAGQGAPQAVSQPDDTGSGNGGGSGGDDGGSDEHLTPIQVVERDHERRRKRIDNKFREKLEQFQEDVDESKDKLDRIDGDVGRPPRYFHPVIRMTILAILMFLELPFNSQAVQLFLRDNLVGSFGMALLIAIVFMLAADFVGSRFKRFEFYKDNDKLLMPAISVGVTLILVCGAAYVVSGFRQAFLDFQSKPSATFEQLLDDRQYVQVAVESLLRPLTLEGWGFYVLNIFLVAAGIIWSAVSHDSHPDYEKWDLKNSAAVRALRKIQDRKTKEQDRELGWYNNVMKRVQARAAKAH